MVSYSMRGNAVVIKHDLYKDLCLNEKSLEQAIKNIEMSKADYASDEAWNTQLAIYKGALSFLQMNKGE